MKLKLDIDPDCVIDSYQIKTFIDKLCALTCYRCKGEDFKLLAVKLGDRWADYRITTECNCCRKQIYLEITSEEVQQKMIKKMKMWGE